MRPFSESGPAAEGAAQIAESALRIEPDLASAHATFGFIHSLFDHRWLEAARDFDESLRRDPRYGTAHHWYALLLAATNDLERALAEIEIASKCERDSRVIEVHKAAILYWSRRYDAAEKQYLEALGCTPDWWYTNHLLGLIYAEQGGSTTRSRRVSFLDVDPRLDSLREDPRFGRLRGQLNLL